MMKQIVDYIIIGGGSAGAVMAARLSEDPTVTVALLEEGGDGRDLVIRTPAAAVVMLPTKINNYAFDTVPQRGLNGRLGYQPRGRALGGSSAINAMVYMRGHRSDYDHWAALGNSGWAYEDVLPYFKRAENNERFTNKMDPFHGQGGPLNVTDLRSDNPFQQIYLEAARQAGFNINDDFNGAEQEGIGIHQVTQINGERCSAARGYLHPIMGKRANLNVIIKAQAQAIVMEGKRAVGVRLVRDGQLATIEARREVILCAGAFQSAQLLMLSGVGDAAHLQQHGIGLVHHLPGVGQNLQDHPDFVFRYQVPSTDLVGVSPASTVRMVREIYRYIKHRRGMITSNYAEGGGFLKLTPESAAPDIQLHFVVASVEDHARKIRMRHGLSCHYCLLRPKSRGSVKLASNRAADAPLIDPAFLEHPDDIDGMIAGFKLTRRLMQAPALSSLYKEDPYANVTDEQIRDAMRKHVDTVYHPIGTCKMGNRSDSMAVVDATLKVHGLENLRVVDASIMPTLIGGNTNAPTVMIAEKAAEMIRR